MLRAALHDVLFANCPHTLKIYRMSLNKILATICLFKKNASHKEALFLNSYYFGYTLFLHNTAGHFCAALFDGYEISTSFQISHVQLGITI